MTDSLPIQLNRVDWLELHVILHGHASPAVDRLLAQIREQARRPRDQFRTRYRLMVSHLDGELFRVAEDDVAGFREKDLDGDDLCTYYHHVASVEGFTFADPLSV